MAACDHRVGGAAGGAGTCIARLPVAHLWDVPAGLAAVHAVQEGRGSLLSPVNAGTAGGREAADGVHTVKGGEEHETPWPGCTDHPAIGAEMQVVE